MNILFIADIVGRPGMEMLSSHLDRLKEANQIDIVIVNGENIAGGKGLTPKLAQKVFSLGVHVITTGNHIWNNNTIYSELDKSMAILRPANYPSMNPGHGSYIATLSSGEQLGVINLQGRSFLYPIDCPFDVAEQEINLMKKKNVSCILIDFHAEATAEKQALARYLDGKISVLIGTHTHVQTADEQILPQGTAYITDAGMTGSFHSVIGMEINASIKRFKSQIGVPYKLADGQLGLNAVVCVIDKETQNAKSIHRIQVKE